MATPIRRFTGLVCRRFSFPLQKIPGRTKAMSAQHDKRTGHCLCGKVTYTFTPARHEITACHCSMCHRWSGGPGLSVEATSKAVVDTGNQYVSIYKSSEWGERSFCNVCGTHLFCSAPEFDHYDVSAGTIDNLDGLALTKEIFIDCKPAAINFTKETQKLTENEFLAMFATTPENE